MHKLPALRLMAALLLTLSLIACGGGDDSGDGGSSDSDPPTSPSNLAVSAVSDTILLVQWKASNDNEGVAGYRVYRDGNDKGDTSVLSYQDSGLDPASEYCYTVTALDDAGNESDPSPQVCASTLAEAVPVGWELIIDRTDSEEGRHVVMAVDGGYVIAGYADFQGFAVGDFYIIKLDTEGNVLWERNVGGLTNEEAWEIQPTSDGGFVVVGEVRGSGAYDFYNMYIVRLDASGTVLWENAYGELLDDDYAYSVAEAADGGFIVAGSAMVYNSVDYSEDEDIYLVRTDASGVFLWDKYYGGDAHDGAGQVIEASDGSIMIAGRTASSGNGASDMLLIKADASGAVLWQHTYGGAEDDLAYSVIEAMDGGFVLVGYTYSYGYGYSDVYLVKTDALGRPVLQKTFGGSGYDYAEQVIEVADGGFVIVGTTSSMGSGWSDVYMVKMGVDGSVAWEWSYGGDDDEYGYSVTEVEEGGLLLTGYVEYDTQANYRDLYVVKTDSFGLLVIP